VCTHGERAAIDRALVAGTPLPAISAEFRVSPDALNRHRAAHLPVRLVLRQALDEAAEGLDITRQLVEVNAAALAILREAREGAQPEVALRAIDRVIKTLEVQVRLVEAADLETRLGALEAHLRGQQHEKGSSQWGR